MISEQEKAEESLALQLWRDSQAEIDPAHHSDLIPALNRLLGWLAEGKRCEQKGMRVVVLLVCVRPDFIEEQSLRQMSRASRQIFEALVLDFQKNFSFKSVYQNGRT
jgi:hypothetical protein